MRPLLAQIANTPQLPPLPEGPALERVRGPVELSAHNPIQIIAIAAGILILLGLIGWLFFRKRSTAVAQGCPYENALNELDAAARLTAEDDERFAVLSSLALRRYLEDSCGLRARARTSEEFLRGLREDAVFDSNFQAQLAEVLAAFDQIKFAGATIEREKRRALSDSVRSLIELTEARFSGKGGKE